MKPETATVSSGRLVMLGFGSIGQAAAAAPAASRSFAAADQIIAPSGKGAAIAREFGVALVQHTLTRENHRAVLEPLLGSGDFLLNLSVDVSSLALIELCRPARRALPRHLHRAVARRLHRQLDACSAAHQLRAARGGAGATDAPAAAARRRSSRRAPIPAWSSLSSSRRCSTSPRDTGLTVRTSRHDRADWAQLAQQPRRQGHPHRRARHPARPAAEAARRVRQHLVGRGLRRPRACSRPSWAGARTSAIGRPTPAGTKPAATPAIYLDRPGAGTRVRSWTPLAGPLPRLPGHPQRVDLDRRLLHAARAAAPWSTGRPALRLPPLRRRRAVAARAGRQQLAAAGAAPRIIDETTSSRACDELGVLLCGARQERLLVRLAALDRGDARSSRPTRTPPACRSPRRCSPAWCGRWKTRRPASSRPTTWTIARCLEIASAVSRAGGRASTPTGRRCGRGARSARRSTRRPVAVQERAGDVSSRTLRLIRGSRRRRTASGRRPARSGWFRAA